MKAMEPLALNQVDVHDDFWSERQQLITDTVLPYQWDALNDAIPGIEPSHTIENFRSAADVSKGGKYHGMFFQDSDLYKWLEAVGFSLSIQDDASLRQKAESAIQLIENAQQIDGYLNTYISVEKPDLKWKNLWRLHELYCAGHLMEAAVAYYEATGNTRLIEVSGCLADHIISVLGVESGKKRGYCGHPEIELALVKMYRVTKDRKYLELSKYFIDERGQEPNYFIKEAPLRGDEPKKLAEYDYNQAHKPIFEQTKAVGHAVRAVYLYSALADLAVEYDDQEMLAAAKRFWRNVVKQQMYITGGIGSSSAGEAFTIDYDLPNDRAYTETCASIGLVFWAQRMLSAEANGEYADVIELALYNNILSGMSLDGKKYFYVNPLEVWPAVAERREDMDSIKTSRQPWFGCACCPPNIARLIASLGNYIYGIDNSERVLYVHQYIGSTARYNFGQPIELRQVTHYPWNEQVTIDLKMESDADFMLALRIPAWCKQPNLTINGTSVSVEQNTVNGYLKIKRTWRDGDQISLLLPMPAERVRSRPDVRANAGRFALKRGPVVYCIEQFDNGDKLQDIVLPSNAELSISYDSELIKDIPSIVSAAFRSDASLFGDELYATDIPATVPTTIKAIPYFLWCNREPGEMLVWIREQ